MSGFFSKFVSGEINESEFEEGLQKYITQLQTLKKCEESQVKEISKAALQIKDEIFNKNVRNNLVKLLYRQNYGSNCHCI